MSAVNADTHRPRRPLSVSLIEERLLSPEEVEEALATERRTGETLAEFVLRTHSGEEEKIGRLLAEDWGLQFVAAAELRVDPRAVERLPLALARDLEAIPIGFGGDLLVVAVARPRRALFARILEELGKTWFVVVPSSALESLLSQPITPTTPEDRPAPTVEAVRSELRAARERVAKLEDELARLGGEEVAEGPGAVLYPSRILSPARIATGSLFAGGDSGQTQRGS